MCQCFVAKPSLCISGENKVLFINVDHVEPEREIKSGFSLSMT